MTRVAILASHNGSGFEALKDAIDEKDLNITIPLVISNNSTANVLSKAKHLHIDSFVINSKQYTDPDQKIFSLLKEYQCDYIFLSGYMKKLSSLLTDNFTIINSHPSLLPKYGGAGMYGSYVHKAVIENKEKKSGVSIHYVDENYDEGKIILQKEYLLSNNETVKSLEENIKNLESEAIIEAFQKLFT